MWIERCSAIAREVAGDSRIVADHPPRNGVAISAVAGIGVETFVREIDHAGEKSPGGQFVRPNRDRFPRFKVTEECVLLFGGKRGERVTDVSRRRFEIQLDEAEGQQAGFVGAITGQLAEKVVFHARIDRAGKLVAWHETIEQGAKGRARKRCKWSHRGPLQTEGERAPSEDSSLGRT